jgi:outer membrane receptor protein involved in Fe transport
LGSNTRFALNGLTDDQIRFFFDGLPLEYSGYPNGISQIPISLIDRVDIYRGVVPISLGADALGGAIDIASRRNFKDHHAFLSIQKGSFGAELAALGVQHRWNATGLYLRYHSFFETADNDFEVNVRVTDDKGKLSPATIQRFHDDYLSFGNSLEAGVTHQPWAKLLMIRAFSSRNYQEVQHSPDMQRPFGEVLYGGTQSGIILRYQQNFSSQVEGDFILGSSMDSSAFTDTSHCAYNWYGECVSVRPFGGEISGTPRDQFITSVAYFGRLNLAWFFGDNHTFRWNVSPTFTDRTGRNQLISLQANDPLTYPRKMLSTVASGEYQYLSSQSKIENVAFIKNYFQKIEAQNWVGGSGVRDQNQSSNLWGAGNAFRIKVTEPLMIKTSYEYSIRQPRAVEVFGDGKLIKENMELIPERSHNANLGLQALWDFRTLGKTGGEVNGFLRLPHHLIHSMGRLEVVYENIYSARSAGLEGSIQWRDSKDRWHIHANTTYLDFRNNSESGPFARYQGNRIPNRPFFFSNGSSEWVIKPSWFTLKEIKLFTHHRYVHRFYRTWESLGAADQKQIIPDQLTHGLGVTAVFQGKALKMGSTAEIQNLTDGNQFDFYGVQKPGRTFSTKINLEF